MILIDPSLKLPSIYHSAKINSRENKNPRKTAYSRNYICEIRFIFLFVKIKLELIFISLISKLLIIIGYFPL